MAEVEQEKNGFQIKGNLFFSLFFKFDQKKIDFKQFAILNALILKYVISKTISKKIQN